MSSAVEHVLMSTFFFTKTFYVGDRHGTNAVVPTENGEFRNRFHLSRPGDFRLTFHSLGLMFFFCFRGTRRKTAVAGAVHVPADGHQLPELETAGHAADVANAESHENDDGGDRRHDVHVRVPPGLQEARAVPGLRRTQPEVHGLVARQLEARLLADVRGRTVCRVVVVVAAG